MEKKIPFVHLPEADRNEVPKILLRSKLFPDD